MLDMRVETQFVSCRMVHLQMCHDPSDIAYGDDRLDQKDEKANRSRHQTQVASDRHVRIARDRKRASLLSSVPIDKAPYMSVKERCRF